MPKKRAREPSNDVVEVLVIESDEEEDNPRDQDDVIFLESVPASSSTQQPTKQNPQSNPIQPPNKKPPTGKTPQTNPILSCPLSKPLKQCSLCRTHDVVNCKTLHCHCGSKIKLPKGRVEAAHDHWNSSMFNK